MSAQLLTVIREQYQDALNAIKTADPDTRSYYEGRRDVLGELLATARVAGLA